MTDQSPAPHPGRREQLGQALPEGIDVLLVSAPENVRYLCGFTGSNAGLLVGRTGDATLATDGRYLIQAAEQAPDVECVDARAVGPTLVTHAVGKGLTRIGFEPHAVTVSVHGRLVQADSSATLVPTHRLVEALRMVKDAAEISALTVACEITDAAFADVVLAARIGVTERDLAFALTTAMRRNGADGDAFDAIVAFGPNSAIPHHPPSDRPLAAGDLLKTDFGARYAGYHADLTRTVVVGKAAGWQQDLHDAVLAVQERGRRDAVVGAVPADLDREARNGIEAAGYRMGHGLGHGVGLQIHEDPFLTPSSTAPALARAMVVTIEPGGYVEGRGGVRIEDTVSVGDAGPLPLTTSPRELLEI